MANVNIAIVSLANSFGQWAIIDGNIANSVNNLRNSDYVKDNGSFIVANGSIQVTSTSGTGLSITNNVLFSQLTQMNTQITTGQASFGLNVNMSNANSTTTIAGNLIAGNTTLGNLTAANTTLGNLIASNTTVTNLTVTGSQTIVGGSLYSTDTLVLRSSLATSGNGQLVVKQGGSNGNAELIFVQPSNVWQVSANVANGFSTILTAANIADSISNSSTISVGSANAVEWAYTTAINAYTQANIANTSTGGSYGQANAAYGQANTANNTANGAYFQANAAYTQANTALTDAKAAYGQANNAYAQANIATTDAQAAYAQANTAITDLGSYLPLSGGTLTGDMFTNSPIVRTSVLGGWLHGGYFNVENGSTPGVIYSIGGPYVPNSANIGLLYGVGYTTATATLNTLPTNAVSGHWGMYLASGGHTNIFLDSDIGSGYFNGLIDAVGAITGGSIWAGSVNLLTFAESVYAQANAAYAQANIVYGQANSAIVVGENAYNEANAAYTQANTALTDAKAAYAVANGAQSSATAASDSAGQAQTAADNAYNQANNAFTIGNNNTAAINRINAPPQSLVFTPGYNVLPGGLIMMWGQSAGNPATINFPFGGFPNECFQVQLSQTISNQQLFSTNITKTQCTVTASTGQSFFWLAIGY